MTFVAALVKTPEFVGSRVPMIQRLHLLLSDPDVIAILSDFVYKPNRSQQRAVQQLIESRTIVYVMEPLIILSTCKSILIPMWTIEKIRAKRSKWRHQRHNTSR